MQTRQRTILNFCAILIGAMVLFPPYEFVINNRTMMSGYAFIFDLPVYISAQKYAYPTQVDVMTLLAQVVGAAFVGIFAFFGAAKN